MNGKALRMRRILGGNRSTLIVPLDHAVTLGVVPGLEDVGRLVELIAGAGANAIVLHKGGVDRLPHDVRIGDLGLIVHLSASTNLSREPNHKRLVCDVEEALEIGADAVSVHVR